MKDDGDVEYLAELLGLRVVPVHEDDEGSVCAAGILPDLDHLPQHHRQSLGRHHGNGDDFTHFERRLEVHLNYNAS